MNISKPSYKAEDFGCRGSHHTRNRPLTSNFTHVSILAQYLNFCNHHSKLNSSVVIVRPTMLFDILIGTSFISTATRIRLHTHHRPIVHQLATMQNLVEIQSNQNRVTMQWHCWSNNYHALYSVVYSFINGLTERKPT